MDGSKGKNGSKSHDMDLNVDKNKVDSECGQGENHNEGALTVLEVQETSSEGFVKILNKSRLMEKWQPTLLFVITTTFAIVGVGFNLLRYFFVLGNFDYWKISKENILIFDNAWSGLSLLAVTILIFLITSLFIYDPKEKQEDLYTIIENYVLSATLTYICISPIMGISFGELDSFLILIAVPMLFLVLVVLSYLVNPKKDHSTVILWITWVVFVWIISISSDLYIKLDTVIKTEEIVRSIGNTICLTVVLLSIPLDVSIFVKQIMKKKNNADINMEGWFWGIIKVLIDLVFIAFLMVIACFIALFLYTLWYVMNHDLLHTTSKYQFILGVCRIFWGELSLNQIWIHVIRIEGFMIMLCMLLNMGIRWVAKKFFGSFDIQIEEYIQKMKKEERFQNVFATLLIMAIAALLIPYLTGNSIAKAQKDFLVIQNLSRSVDSTAPNWIVLHEDKDSYIVAEYEEQDNKKGSSNGEDKKSVNIYNEVQTIIKKEGVTVYKKTFSEVTLKKGTKPKEMTSESASS